MGWLPLIVTGRRFMGSKHAGVGSPHPRLPVESSSVRRRIRSSLVSAGLAVLAAGAGCAESVAGPATPTTALELVGRWVSSRNNLSPEGWNPSSLTFTIDGRFTSENRMYGLYEGQRRDDLSAFTRIEGRYRIVRDQLTFEPLRLVWWDHFYGARSREHVEDPYPWGDLFDDARYSMRDDHLTMSFTVYPADAPLPAVAEYTRDR